MYASVRVSMGEVVLVCSLLSLLRDEVVLLTLYCCKCRKKRYFLEKSVLDTEMQKCGLSGKASW